jgi:hypothetical protein
VYYYQEFTRKLLESHPESGSGNYLEGTMNSGFPCCRSYRPAAPSRRLKKHRWELAPTSEFPKYFFMEDEGQPKYKKNHGRARSQLPHPAVFFIVGLRLYKK